MLVLGDRKHINLDYLANFGDVQELTMEQIFGY